MEAKIRHFLYQEDNKYKFDSFGNVGEPTNLDVVVNDEVGTDVDVLEIIKNNKSFFYDNIKHMDCYFFNEHVIRLLGQPIPIYTMKKNEDRATEEVVATLIGCPLPY